MTLAASDWWDSTGALVLLTGTVTICATAIPLALRPWSENRIRRAERQEDRLDRWDENARALSVELETMLEKYVVSSLFDQTTLVMMPWEAGGLRTRAALILRFAPTATLRKLGVHLFHDIDLLHHRAFRLVMLRRDHPDDPRLTKAVEGYGETHGEAVLTLAGFAEAIGGPTAPGREAFALPLKTDNQKPASSGHS